MKHKALKGLMLATSFVCAGAAFGADIHGRTSSQFGMYTDLFDGQRHVDLSQYLNVNVTNIDPAGKLSLHAYGKGVAPLKNGGDISGRLYYLYGEYKGLFDKGDLRLGRQFINTSAGSSIVDGLYADLNQVGPVGYSLYGGRNVIFSVDGEASHAGDYVFGATAYLNGQKNTDLELSWMRKTDRYEVARDVLGANFKQNLFDSVSVYGNTKFDLVKSSFDELQTGVKYFPTNDLAFTAEWYQSYPTFDTTSLYSAFAVERYKEWVATAEYAVNDQLSLNGGFTHEMFGGSDTVNAVKAGFGWRPYAPVKIGFEYDNQHGYSGWTNGFAADVSYDVTQNLSLSGGLAYDVFQRDVVTNEEIARKYWAGGRYRIDKNKAVSLHVQNEVDSKYERDVNARFAFDYDF